MTVAAGLQGALLLARGRAEGMALVDANSAARSFWALALCLPAFLFLRVLDWMWDGLPAAPTHASALELLGYLIGWLGFAVASRPLVASLNRADQWELFLATWNWCNVVQYLLLVAASIPRLLGAPDWISETAGLVALGWALWLEWYAARLSLDIDALPAAGLVALDVGIGIALSAVIGALS
jgi:hypothetical protein